MVSLLGIKFRTICTTALRYQRRIKEGSNKKNDIRDVGSTADFCWFSLILDTPGTRTNQSKKIQGRITIESENNKIRKISKVSDATYFSDVVFVGTGGCVNFFLVGGIFLTVNVLVPKKVLREVCKKKIVPFSRVLTLRPPTPPSPAPPA